LTNEPDKNYYNTCFQNCKLFLKKIKKREKTAENLKKVVKIIEFWVEIWRKT